MSPWCEVISEIVTVKLLIESYLFMKTKVRDEPENASQGRCCGTVD